MVSQLPSEAVGPYPNPVDIRLSARRPIYRIASWIFADLALPALATNGARPWPKKVGATTSISASCRILCSGPAEWLAIGGESGVPMSDMATLAVVELTEAFAHIELLGEEMEEPLTSMYDLDVYLAAFAPDTCARTRHAGGALILDRHGQNAFACYVSPGYVGYLLAALRESARGLMHVQLGCHRRSHVE